MTDGITPSAFHAAEGTEDWRVVGDGACAFYRTPSFADAVAFVSALAAADGVAEHPPDVDVRTDGVTLRLLTASADYYGLTGRDVVAARAISAVARAHGLMPEPAAVQSVLIVPGAPDASAVVPFWQAALAYRPRADSPDEDLVDPQGRWPGLWFEGMDEPRGDGGGAVHVAVWVPPEEAEGRVAAALAAGGRIVRDRFAPSWWTLADAAGNEVDVATVIGRD